jgi:hypothetical protein
MCKLAPIWHVPVGVSGVRAPSLPWRASVVRPALGRGVDGDAYMRRPLPNLGRSTAHLRPIRRGPEIYCRVVAGAHPRRLLSCSTGASMGHLWASRSVESDQDSVPAGHMARGCRESDALEAVVPRRGTNLLHGINARCARCPSRLLRCSRINADDGRANLPNRNGLTFAPSSSQPGLPRSRRSRPHLMSSRSHLLMDGKGFSSSFGVSVHVRSGNGGLH